MCVSVCCCCEREAAENETGADKASEFVLESGGRALMREREWLTKAKMTFDASVKKKVTGTAAEWRLG